MIRKIMTRKSLKSFVRIKTFLMLFLIAGIVLGPLSFLGNGVSITSTGTLSVKSDVAFAAHIVDTGGWEESCSYTPEEITIQPHSGAQKDNYIQQNNAGTNYGAGTTLFTNSAATKNTRSILEFDLSDIPAEATITSVTMSLRYYIYYAGDPVGNTIRLYRLRRADWEELESTWNTYKTSNIWSIVGASDTDDDIDTDADFLTDSVVPAGAAWMTWTGAAMVNLAQDAIDNRGDKLIVRLHDTSTTWEVAGFISGDYTVDTDYCPKIYIEYDEAVELPTVTTQAVSAIAATSATGNGNITDTGGENTDEWGFVYDTTNVPSNPGNVSPAVSDYDEVENEAGSRDAGVYDDTLTGLVEGVRYYVRAYAHNSAGYAYGDEVEFITVYSQPPEWLSDWENRVKITVDDTNIDSNLNHFPITMFLGTSVGQNSDDVSFIFDELESDANRFKIAVTKGDGTTQLDVEIDYWDDASETAVLHAGLPSYVLPAVGDTLYLYFDSTQDDNPYITEQFTYDVYDDYYDSIYHLNDASVDVGVKNSVGLWSCTPRSVYFNGVTYHTYVDASVPDLKITAYNHGTNTWATPETIAVSYNEAHCAPSMAIDSSGYIYVVYGGYNQAQGVFLYKSTTPEVITGWSADLSPYSDVGASAYAILLIDSSDNVIIVWRDGDELFKVYSIDGGDNWSAAQLVIDLDATDRIYPHAVIDSNDRVHLAWSIFDSPYYSNAYYIYTDNPCNASTVWKDVTGETISLPMAKAEAYRVVYTGTNEAGLQAIRVNSDDKPYLLFHTATATRVYEYSSATWNYYTITTEDLPTASWFDGDLHIDGQYTINVILAFGDDTNKWTIREYQSTTETPSFSKIKEYKTVEAPLLLNYVTDASDEVNIIYRSGHSGYSAWGYWVYSGSDTSDIPKVITPTTPVVGIVNSLRLGVSGTKTAADQPEEVAGMVGMGQDFDGTGEGISLVPAKVFSASNPWTCEFLINATSATHMVIGKDAAYNYIAINVSGDLISFTDAGGETDSQAADMTNSTNHYVCLVASGTEAPTVYLDGISKGQLSAGNLSSDWTIDELGSAYAAGSSENYDLRGILDEVRISTTARSADWILATFHSISDDLLTYGSASDLISNTPPSHDFGLVELSSTTSTSINQFSVTNNSGGPIDITIRGTNLTGGTQWTLSDTATPGADIVGIKAGVDDVEDTFNVTVRLTAPYNALYEGLAGNTSLDWGLQLLAPTSFSDGIEKTGIITLTATISD